MPDPSSETDDDVRPVTEGLHLLLPLSNDSVNPGICFLSTRVIIAGRGKFRERSCVSSTRRQRGALPEGPLCGRA
jgi:hypothetical protein